MTQWTSFLAKSGLEAPPLPEAAMQIEPSFPRRVWLRHIHRSFMGVGSRRGLGEQSQANSGLGVSFDDRRFVRRARSLGLVPEVMLPR